QAQMPLPEPLALRIGFSAMPWNQLDRELKSWSAAGLVAELWWRDDDAATATPSLSRLLELTGRAGIPLALAVVPAAAELGLAAAVGATAHTTVLQHGYAHANHAPAGAKAVECGGGRPATAVMGELAAGRERLVSLFGHRFLPVLVPPRNRIDPLLLPRLTPVGFPGFSSLGPRSAPEAGPRVPHAHVHADPIAWRKDRRFAGTDSVLDALMSHLAAKREGRADRTEPTGILTHHLVHDAEGWSFLHTLVSWATGRNDLRWVKARSLFGDGG